MRHAMQSLLVLMGLAGCSTMVENVEGSTSGGNALPPHHSALPAANQDPIQGLSLSLASSLMQQYDGSYKYLPMAVATPVLASDYRKSDRFTRQLELSLITALHKQGFNLVEVNAGKVMRIKPQGNHYLSRNYKDLTNQASVTQVLATTVDPGTEWVRVQAKLLNLADQRVLSVAQERLSWDELKDYYEPSGQVSLRQGKLVRHTGPGSSILISLED